MVDHSSVHPHFVILYIPDRDVARHGGRTPILKLRRSKRGDEEAQEVDERHCSTVHRIVNCLVHTFEV